MFCDEMLDLFKKLPVNFPKPVDYINKIKKSLRDIGGK